MYRLAVTSSALVFFGCAASDPPATDRPDPEPVPTVSPAPAEPGGIQAVEPPAVPEQPVPVQANAPEIVCQLERRTGSNRKVRVCRQQTSAADAAAARETFDALRRQQIDLDQ